MANDGTIGRTMRGPMRVNNAIDPLSTSGAKAATARYRSAPRLLYFTWFLGIQA
jgi:hypothetical protein